ncbi:MAG: hypothetical protein VCA18_06740, partial [Opitutales bacterium]
SWHPLQRNLEPATGKQEGTKAVPSIRPFVGRTGHGTVGTASLSHGPGVASDNRHAPAACRESILELFGRTNPVLVHHRPSGKLILATGLEFAENLFIPKPNLAADPAFRKTMAGLPKKGTAMAYVSPVLFSGLREVSEKVIDAENDRGIGRAEHLVATTFLNLFLPKNSRGEGSVTTNDKDGILTVSNSAHSHKANIISSAASPLLMAITASFSSLQPVLMMDDVEAVHDHEVVDPDQFLELEQLLDPGLKQRAPERGD